MSDVAESSSSAAGSSSGEQVPKIRVLIADNDALMLRIHKNLLENKFNMEVDTVINGMEAVCAFREGLKYDILFLEHKISVLDGLAVARTLRRNNIKSMIVGMYGRATEDEQNAFGRSGLNILVQKPLTEDLVKAILEKYNE